MPARRSSCARTEGALLRLGADRHDRHGPRCGGRLGQQHGQPLDPGGPADTGDVRSAHLAHQAVVAAAGHYRALGAKRGGRELEGGVGVVVQAADQARAVPAGDAEPRQALLDAARRSPGSPG